MTIHPLPLESPAFHFSRIPPRIQGRKRREKRRELCRFTLPPDCAFSCRLAVFSLLFGGALFLPLDGISTA
jgi:hypothetical protein